MEIRLHGILAVEFGDIINMDIDNLDFIVDAISCNKKGFKNRLISLHNDGFYYSVLVDGKIVNNKADLLKKDVKRVDFVPIISGCFGWFVALVIFVVAVAVVSTIIALATAPDPPKPPELRTSSQALSQSFRFQNAVNFSDQGATVPIGYGELIVGSQVVMSTKKVFSLGRSKQKSYSSITDNDDKGSKIDNYSTNII